MQALQFETGRKRIQASLGKLVRLMLPGCCKTVPPLLSEGRDPPCPHFFLLPPPTPPALPFLAAVPLPLAGLGGSLRLPPAVDDFMVTGPKKDSRRPAPQAHTLSGSPPPTASPEHAGTQARGVRHLEWPWSARR